MHHFNRRKYSYEEYYFNDTAIKKLYHAYVEKSIWDRILDKVVFGAMLFLIMNLVLEWLIGVDNTVFIFINSFSSLVLVIFGLEMTRLYAQSKSGADFIRRHWIDFILLIFLSFYFLFITSFGMLKLYIIDLLKPYAQDTKHIRALYKIFTWGR